MAKVLAVEVGASLIRFAEVDYKTKNPKVHRVFTVPTPKDTKREDSLTINEELVNVMKSAMSENHIGTKQIIFALNSTKVASKEVLIPFVKENRVADVVRANASDFFPVDLEQYELGHCITDTIEANNKKQYKLLVYAAPKSLIESYKDLASALGCTVAAFDYVGNSIYQLVRNQVEEGAQMIIKLDEMSSNVTIVKNKVVVLQRNITYGINELIDIVKKSSACPTGMYEDALQFLCENSCFKKANDLEIEDLDNPNGFTDAIQREINSSSKAFTNAVTRVVDFYMSRGEETPVSKVYITGLGGDVMGLPEFLGAALNLPTEALNEVDVFNLEKDLKDVYAGRFLSCIGATVAPIGFMAATGNKKGAKDSSSVSDKEKQMETISWVFFIGGIAVAVILAVVSIVNLSLANRTNKKLNARIEELQPVKQIYMDYLQTQYTNDKLNYLYGETVTKNENLLLFISEMEEKMPASLNVLSFNSNKEGIDMAITVADKRAAAKLIQQFRTFDSLAGVQVTAISDSGASTDGTLEAEGKVSFSVSLAYKQITDEENLETPTEEQTEETATEEAAVEE